MTIVKTLAGKQVITFLGLFSREDNKSVGKDFVNAVLWQDMLWGRSETSFVLEKY